LLWRNRIANYTAAWDDVTEATKRYVTGGHCPSREASRIVAGYDR
jgi:hypothetical protein